MNKEIIEGNKLIAQFMGIETKVYSDTPTVTRWNFGGFMRQENDMKYHTSWDWLMPVVEKIRNDRKTISSLTLTLGFIFDKAGISATSWNGIEDLWKAVVSFIKWHNESTSQEKQS